MNFYSCYDLPRAEARIHEKKSNYLKAILENHQNRSTINRRRAADLPQTGIFPMKREFTFDQSTIGMLGSGVEGTDTLRAKRSSTLFHIEISSGCTNLAVFLCRLLLDFFMLKTFPGEQMLMKRHIFIIKGSCVVAS